MIKFRKFILFFLRPLLNFNFVNSALLTLSNFKFGVIPSSHVKESLMTKIEILVSKFIGIFFGARTGLYLNLLSIKPKWIEVNKGDCIIFNQKLLHRGSKVKGPKYAIYSTFGKRNDFSRRHNKYYLEREDLDYGEMPEDFDALLNELDLNISN